MPYNNILLVNLLNFRVLLKLFVYETGVSNFVLLILTQLGVIHKNTNRTIMELPNYKDHTQRIKQVNMIKFSNFDKRSKNKVSRRVRMNLSTHPFVIVAIVAAISVTVWAVAFFIFRF